LGLQLPFALLLGARLFIGLGALLPWIAGILAQGFGIGILFPYLLALAVALLGPGSFWLVQ